MDRQGKSGGRGPVGRLKSELGLQGWRRGWAQQILQWQSARPLLFTGLGNEEQIRAELKQIGGMGWGGMLDSTLAC